MDDFRSLNLNLYVTFCIFAYMYFSGNKVEDFHRIISGISDINLKPLPFSVCPAFGHTFPVQPSGKEMMSAVFPEEGETIMSWEVFLQNS